MESSVGFLRPIAHLSEAAALAAALIEDNGVRRIHESKERSAERNRSTLVIRFALPHDEMGSLNSRSHLIKCPEVGRFRAMFFSQLPSQSTGKGRMRPPMTMV